MRNAAHHIRPHFDGAPHQGLAVGEGLNALLWKCHQLQRDLIRKFLSDLEQRPQRRELGVANVDVAADEEDPVRDLPAEHLGNPALDVFDRQVLDPLTPDRDALEERAAEVVPRLANGEDGIGWMCGSTRAGVSRPPRASMTLAGWAAPAGGGFAILPPSMAIDASCSDRGSRALVISRSGTLEV